MSLTREHLEEWREMFLDPAPWASEKQRVYAINATFDLALSSLPPDGGETKAAPQDSDSPTRVVSGDASSASRPAGAAPNTGPCPDGDACPDARRYGAIHPKPAGAAPNAEPADMVSVPRDALALIAALPLSSEPMMSDLLHRSPAGSLRKAAEEMERKDVAIQAARNALAAAQPGGKK